MSASSKNAIFHTLSQNKLNQLKAFFFSLFLHSTLLVAYIYSSDETKSSATQERPNIVTVSLLATPPKSQAVQETPKKIQKAPQKPKQQKIVKKQKPLQKKKVRVEKKPPLKTPKVLQKKLAKKTKTEPKKTKTTQAKPLEKKLTETQTQEPRLADAKPEKNSQTPTQVVAKKSTQTPAPKPVEKISQSQLAQIRSMIQNSLVYPSIARRLKIEGVVTVAFVLSADGRVISADIVTRSGNSALDKKALSTVLALSGEYPHLNRKIDLQIPISFSLKNS